jgi:hypothetical protein
MAVCTSAPTKKYAQYCSTAAVAVSVGSTASDDHSIMLRSAAVPSLYVPKPISSGVNDALECTRRALVNSSGIGLITCRFCVKANAYDHFGTSN